MRFSDVSRRISGPSNGAICKRMCVASDRACTRVTLRNLHGKKGVDGSSPSECLRKVPVNRHFLVVCKKNTRTHLVSRRLRRASRVPDMCPLWHTFRARQDRVACRSSLQRGEHRCPSWRETYPSLQRRGRRRLNGTRFLAEPQGSSGTALAAESAEAVPDRSASVNPAERLQARREEGVPVSRYSLHCSRLRLRPVAVLRLDARYGRLNAR